MRPHEDFHGRVRAAVGEVQAGRLEKVVLVREVLVEANGSFLVDEVVSRLRVLYPSCATFSIDGLVGASPELLVERCGDGVRSHPLAGTIARSGDAETDARLAAELLSSRKDRTEHRVVVETIAAALAAVCSDLAADETPSIVALRNVAHLGSVVSGRLAGPPAPGALELVALLHPTPAVAGTPLKAALDYLAKAEDLDRGRFAGPAGYVQADGDGEWFVGIRSAIVDGPSARLLAGVGIVADSDPDAELAETQLKLQALLSAAVRP